MCLSCGCRVPDDTHGDSRNIVMKQIVDAAAAESADVATIMKNIDAAVADVLKGELKSSAYPGRRTRR